MPAAGNAEQPAQRDGLTSPQHGRPCQGQSATATSWPTVACGSGRGCLSSWRHRNYRLRILRNSLLPQKIVGRKPQTRSTTSTTKTSRHSNAQQAVHPNNVRSLYDLIGLPVTLDILGRQQAETLTHSPRSQSACASSLPPITRRILSVGASLS